MMIIDPQLDGCTIWNGRTVQYIQGTAKECCERIVKYLDKISDDRWSYDIAIDTKGIGLGYADYFTEKGIFFRPIVQVNVFTGGL